MKSRLFGKNKILVLILALAIMAEFFLPQKTVVRAGIAASGSVADIYGVGKTADTTAIKAVIERTFEKIRITDEIIENAGTSDCDWPVFAIGRYVDAYGGESSFGDLEAYGGALCEYVRGKYAQSGGLHRNKATEWHRISLALLACGGNPEEIANESVGGGTINLIADGTYGCVTGAPWRQGVNGAIYALITLDATDVPVPDGAAYSRDDIINYIISQELDGGGFSLAGQSAARYDTDVTAMAVQALADYRTDREDVSGVVDRALACLQDGLGTDASYGNASSTAQVLLALTCADVNVTEDKRFIAENGQNMIDGILNFYDAEESMFCLTKNSEPGFMTTAQCLYALTGWCRRADGFTGLYDFGKMSGQPEKPVRTPKPDMTPKPVVTQNPGVTPTPDAGGTPTPDVTPNNMQTEAPNPANADKRKTDRAGTDRTKTNQAKTAKVKPDGLKADIFTYNNSNHEKVISKHNKKNNKWKSGDNDNKTDTGQEDTYQDYHENVGDSGNDSGDIVIKRDEAYVTEAELADIIGADRNIMIDGAFDDTHRCLVTINGADVNACRLMNLKVSAGSGSALYDKEIEKMAPEAFILKLESENGIDCDALYSVETSLAAGEYLLMKYVGGEAEYTDKAEVADGYLRFVTDSPGIYFVCREVKIKDKVKSEPGDEIKDNAETYDNSESGFEKYMAGAVLAAAAAVLCVFIYRKYILKGRKNDVFKN